VLLGLVREDEGIAIDILSAAGVDSERIRTDVLAALSGPGATVRAAAHGRLEPSPELAEARLALLDGLLAAWERRTEIFTIVAEAPDRAATGKRIAHLLHASEGMADRILNHHLGDMTQADGARLQQEREELRRRLDAGEI
jgi:DNA gyrase/topoisomerase IV subunit A